MTIDPTSITLPKIPESILSEIYQAAKGVAAKSLGKLQAELGIGFQAYIERNGLKCRYVKTLLHRIDPIPIEEAYVEPRLKIRKQVFKGSDFPEQLSRSKRIVVVGNGGSGKSMFMKQLFLELCEFPLASIPIFVELRDINSRTDKDLIKLVHEQWTQLIPSFQLPALEAGLRSGKFALLLDGYDEVEKEHRELVGKSILEVSYKFPASSIVMTSRPIDDFVNWQEFYTAEIQPLNITEVNELVGKTKIDSEVKQRFLKEVKARLFQSHGSFLSNPLLCTMMVLTYTEFEEIPSKMHIFYDRAFDVLFTRHDKTKTFFTRKFYTTLAEDDFRRLLSTFCLFSYLEGAYSFDRPTALRLLGRTFEFENSDTKPGEFLADLHESISILVRDGDTFSFLHRSFQEYFTALFLADRQVPNMSKLIELIFERGIGEQVLRLLFEINREVLESHFIIPKVKKLRSEFGKLDPRRDLPKMLSLICSEIGFERSGRHRPIRLKFGSKYRLLELLAQLYGTLSPDEHFFGARSIEQWTLICNGRGQTVSVTSLPNSGIKKSTFAAALAQAKSQIIELDRTLRTKNKKRDDFLSSLIADQRT